MRHWWRKRATQGDSRRLRQRRAGAAVHMAQVRERGGPPQKKQDQQSVRRRMREAYRKHPYEEAPGALKALQAELEPQERQAANSLAEGMDLALTLHKLGVAGEIGGSLRTANIIKNVNSHLGERTRRVKPWMNSDQRQRWVAMAMWETEPRLRPLNCAKLLHKLHKALSECVSKQYLESISNRLRALEVNYFWHHA